MSNVSSASNAAATDLDAFVCDDELAKLFPLTSICDVVRFFRTHLESAKEPDLTLLSIVTGCVENSLTGKCNASLLATQAEAAAISNNNNAEPANGTVDDDMTVAKVKGADIGPTSTADVTVAKAEFNNFPVITLDVVRELYAKFMRVVSLVGPCKRISASREPKKASRSATPVVYATREIIKHVSDVVWNSLIRSTYKDRAHLQSLYSYLADSKLDCFGVALTVVAGCQQLGYNDAHLAISEDHAWVIFGKTGEETIEVTWHGKGAEDKRGQSVMQGYESHSWLYLSGNPVVCDRLTEVGAIVSSINPSLSATSACLEVAELQQRLLWLLYDMHYLGKYPMGIGCLGELEEVAATENRTACIQLYQEAIEVARVQYKNHHVYPYTYLGGYHYRQKQYKEAFAAWADAGSVIRLYNYNSRDDEEIYKEFLDIANELIPQIMKMESSGHSAASVLRDSQCFANLLRFYDGICIWEQGSLTPILHIGWVKPLVTTISRFDSEIRAQVIIHCANENGERDDDNGSTSRAENNNNDVSTSNQESDTKKVKADDVASTTDAGAKSSDTVHTTLVEALTAACREKILNPDFLLQGSTKPFADQQIKSEPGDEKEKQLLLLAQTSPRRCDEVSAESAENRSPAVASDAKASDIKSGGDGDAKSSIPATGPVFKETSTDDLLLPKRPEITLYSQKMKGLKDLLLAEKLNTHAISLQLTAQSQVHVAGKKSRSVGAINYALTTKRTRRE